MVQNIIQIGKREDQVLNIVKAKFGLKNKSEAVALIAKVYEESFLEPELKPEYLEKLNNIEKEGYGKTFSSIEQLKRKIRKR